MDDKQAARADKVRQQAGIPGWVPVSIGRQGWAAYANGILTVKMTLTPQVVIPIQDITAIDLKPAGSLTNGHVRFNRATDKFGDRQDILFGSQDEAIFADLKRTIKQEQGRGARGQLPPPPPAPAVAKKEVPEGPSREELSEAKYRAKYKIPPDALLARASARGYVAFDGHFVTIQHVAIGRFTVGKGVKRIPVTAISSVQIKMPGWALVGYIQFPLPGGNEVRSDFGRQTIDAAHDENSMGFERPEAAAFLAMRDAIEAAQRALHQPQVIQAPAPPPAPPADDVFAQLEKLGKLRDAGIVTDAEFEAKKAELLGRM